MVENDDALRRALARILTTLGETTTTVGSYEDAVVALSAGAVYDVVLSDHDLESDKGTGADVLRLAQRIRPDVRLVLMSGEDRRYEDLGTFLPKPFTREMLVRVLSR